MRYSNTLGLVEFSGELAQMVERSLSMREVRGSMPRFSKSAYFATSLPLSTFYISNKA